MSRTVRRVAATTMMAMAAAMAPVALAAPAHADVEECMTYLIAAGEVPNEGHEMACAVGQATHFDECYEILLNYDVMPDVAYNACKEATDR